MCPVVCLLIRLIYLTNKINNRIEFLDLRIGMIDSHLRQKALPPANRKPRTEEQKAASAETRRKWWEKKRQDEKLSDPSAASPTQETVE